MGNSPLNCSSVKKSRKDPMPTKSSKDIEGDGKVTFEEFKTLLNQYHLGFNDEQILTMFKYYDKDNNDYLSLDEVSWLFSQADSDSNKLAVRIRVAVPSTSGVNEAIDLDAFKTRLVSFETLLCTTFGSCTVYPAQEGSYLANNGEIVQEKVASVETISTKNKWAQKEEIIRETIKSKCIEWGQECLALEINGVLEYVAPDNDNTSAVVDNGESLLRQLAVRVHMAKNIKES